MIAGTLPGGKIVADAQPQDKTQGALKSQGPLAVLREGAEPLEIATRYRFDPAAAAQGA